jgi:ABC-2 type transport system permease protein
VTIRRIRSVYGQHWRINLLTALEYRENFLLWSAFTVVYHGTAIATLWVVLHTFPFMNGWDFKDMAFLYGLWMLAHALHDTAFFGVANVPEYIRDGEFDRLLLRPLDTLFAVIAVESTMSVKRIVRVPGSFERDRATTTRRRLRPS